MNQFASRFENLPILKKRILASTSFSLLLLSISCVRSEEITVAVASNFQATLLQLKTQFEENSEHEITIVSGSTGKLYAQIVNGAPFDLFLSADVERPRKLVSDLKLSEKSRFSYANGRLVLWSALNEFVDSEGRVLLSENFDNLALANPKLAPYGLAAKNYLDSLKLDNINTKLVNGENISQTYHLISSESAELGFIALSQLKKGNKVPSGSFWVVPESKHEPIEQQGVMLNSNESTKTFVDFILSKQGQKVIQNFGYSVTRVGEINAD